MAVLSVGKIWGSAGCSPSTVLPGIDEVLGNVDTSWWACDRDLAHGWAINGAGNFDVSSRHLTDLIDLAALSSNYAANKLQRKKTGTCK